jgi:hypothetical protein
LDESAGNRNINLPWLLTGSMADALDIGRQFREEPLGPKQQFNYHGVQLGQGIHMARIFAAAVCP